MTKELVIFGSGDMAELAHYYFTKDSEYSVVAFTVDSEFLIDERCCGLPVVPFEELCENYSVEKYYIFIALSYSKLNKVRKDRYNSAIDMGYKIAKYVSSKATVLNESQIGDNCFILEDNTIQPFVEIGNNVTLWSGNHIGHHSKVGDHTFVASHVVISGGVEIGEQCFIGVNATLRDHIIVGRKSIIGAGVLLLKNADEESVYIASAPKPIDKKSNSIKKI